MTFCSVFVVGCFLLALGDPEKKIDWRLLRKIQLTTGSSHEPRPQSDRHYKIDLSDDLLEEISRAADQFDGAAGREDVLPLAAITGRNFDMEPVKRERSEVISLEAWRVALEREEVELAARENAIEEREGALRERMSYFCDGNRFQLAGLTVLSFLALKELVQLIMDRDWAWCRVSSWIASTAAVVLIWGGLVMFSWL